MTDGQKVVAIVFFLGGVLIGGLGGLILSSDLAMKGGLELVSPAKGETDE